MRTSCNGCRVLRKGCNDGCAIRPCLDWIKSSDAQANATVFLAKFYGRAGLLNLLNAGPEHLRPAIFQSLLYEACGRVVDPVYGSVGLLYSGQWQHCQVAVDSVLKGLPVMQLPPNGAPQQQRILLPPLQLYDIRHMTAARDLASAALVQARNHHARTPRVPVAESDRVSFNHNGGDEEDDRGNQSMFSGGTSTSGSGSGSGFGQVGESEPTLELTLGFNKYG